MTTPATSKVWFTSDSHFFHANVIQYCNRPFSSVEEMNRILISNWNSVVDQQDVVYHLGDFSLSFRAVELFTRELNGTKFLVPGNHDSCHSYNKKARTEEKRWNRIAQYEELGWSVLPEQITLDLGKDIGEVLMCHHPYSWDSNGTEGGSDKYARWRPVDDGQRWLLHGHRHSTIQDNLDRRMIDVGVDANEYTPTSLETIKELILANS